MPNDGEARIKLTGDETSLVNGFKKAFKEIGDEGAKASEKMFKGFGKTLIAAGVIKQTIAAVAQTMTAIDQKVSAMNTASGHARASAEIALADLRKATRTPEQNLGLIRSATGSRTQEERTAFAGQADKSFTESGFAGAFLAYNTGLVSQEEALKAGRGGSGSLRRLQQLVQRRRARVSQQTRTELGIRSVEAEDQLRVLLAGEQTGEAERLAASQRDAFGAEHPIISELAANSAIGTAVGNQIQNGRQGAASDRARGVNNVTTPGSVDHFTAGLQSFATRTAPDQLMRDVENIPGLGPVTRAERGQMGARAWTKELLMEIRAQTRAANRPNLSASQDRQ